MRSFFASFFLTFGLVSALPVALAAQAFGVSQGIAVDELDVQHTMGSGMHMVTVPKPHPEFEGYAVTASDKTGVCAVTAVGRLHKRDGYGTSVRGVFEDLETALTGLYGKHEEKKFVRSGALWKDPDDWVMAVRQNERVHAAIWDTRRGSTLPSGLDRITVMISAASSSSARITMLYDFANRAECDAALEKEANSGL